MTKEDILRMARQAGFEIGSVTNAIYAPTSCETELERFAALVAAAEREACAKVCEDSVEYAADTLAQAIRARGQPKKIKAVQEDDYCYGDERYYAND